jgi:two-component system sensor histidine kinase AlgZ
VLARQPYRIGVALIYAIGVAIGVAVHLGLRQMFPGAQDSMLKHLLLSIITTAVLIGYFRLRMRALSPAIAEARLQALQARIRPHFLFNSLTACCRSCAATPSGPRKRCTTWPTCSAC